MVAISGALISIGAAVIGGVLSARAQNSNARNTTQFAQTNANNTLAWGSQQANMIMMAAKYNTAVMSVAAKAQAQATMDTAIYNAELMRQINNFNFLMAEEEADSIYEAADLDSEVLRKQYMAREGEFVANAAASGTLIEGGSNQDVVAHLKAEEALNQVILATNAKNAARNVLNKAQISSWESLMATKKMLYEAGVSGQLSLLNASAGSSSALFDGHMQSLTARQSAANRAQESLITAGQQSRNYNQAATSSYVSAGLKVAEVGASLL